MTRRRTARRQTFWVGAAGSFTLATINVTVGTEVLSSSVIVDAAPATLIRIRGHVWWTSVSTNSDSMPTMVYSAIRKVSLATTDATFTTVGGNIALNSAFLAAEDILWTGVTKFPGGLDTGTESVRPAGHSDVDIKAKRKFGSGEERLVIESMMMDGGSQDLTFKYALRCLFLAG